MSDTQRRSHAQWRELIGEQEKGEQTILGFCKQRAVSVHSFHYHKRKIREETRGGFQEVEPVGRGPIRLIRRPQGWCVEVDSGFNTRCLLEVLRTLA